MSPLRIMVTVIFFVICAVLLYLVFLGKGEGADLSGAIVARNNDTYFSTHGKKHTKEALREKATFAFLFIFIAFSIILNMGWGL